MPLRNPQEIGVRQTWSRRYGVNEFPRAGGMARQGRQGDVPADDFWLLENARWNDPRLKGRGGQVQTAEAVDGCILGLFEVEDTLAILVGSGGSERLDRYKAEQSPEYLEPTIAEDEPLPSLGARRNIINFDGKILELSADPADPTALICYQVNFPAPITPADQVAALTKASRLFDLPEAMNTWVWKFELDTQTDSPTYQRPIPILYLGALLSGLVYRWDGQHLTQDTPASLGPGAVVLAVFLNDIVACGEGWIKRRNYSPLTWDSSSYVIVGSTAFVPQAGAEYAGRFFFAGSDASLVFPAGPGCILYLDPATNTVLTHVPIDNSPDLFPGFVCSDLAVFQGLLHFCWSGTGHVSNPGFIGTVDPALVWTDVVYTFTDEAVGLFGAMLSTAGNLYVSNTQDEPSGDPPGTSVPGLRVLENGTLFFTTLRQYNTGPTPGLPLDLVAL